MSTFGDNSLLGRYFVFCDEVSANAHPHIFAKHPYSEARQKHFRLWSEDNLKTLQAILESEVFETLILGKLDVAATKLVAFEVERHLFSECKFSEHSLFDLLHEARAGLSKAVDYFTHNQTLDKWNVAERIARKGFCVILVRPEVLYLEPLVIELLEWHGYEVVSSNTLTLSAEQYIALYNHVFEDITKESHVRRRAFGYVNQKCHSLLIRKRGFNGSTEAPILHLNREVKGVVRVEDRVTIRGGMGMSEAIINYSDNDPLIRLALDPYNSYTLLDSTTKDLPLRERFVSNLHSVHIPNQNELVKDLCILCSYDVLSSL